jgi:hypothetical protein
MGMLTFFAALHNKQVDSLVFEVVCLCDYRWY